MKFGYARVSKNEQSLDIQTQKLTAAGCEEIFQEKISGAKDSRPQLDAVMNKLRKGGRPKALTNDKAETIKALRQAGKMSVKKICETMKISRSVFYRCINQ